MSRVVIIQEYIPAYRVAFFEALHERAQREGIELVVACGRPRELQGLRGDAGTVSFMTPLRQREWTILRRRVVIRRVKDVIADADLVILEQARRNVDAYPLLARRRHRHQLVALWGHGTDYTKPTKPFDRSLRRWLTSRADWFFAYTEGGVEAVAAQGYPRAQTTLVQNSIDTTLLRDSVAAVTRESVDSFNGAHDLRGKTALFVGALDESKRLPFLREAAEKSYELDPGFRLLIAGDGDMRVDVEHWATQYSWLTYLGPVSGDDKAVAFAASQVLAMPGRVGLVAVDSFAAAVPIVTTCWSWHAPEFEYLEDGRNSLVTADQTSAYARRLIELLCDKDLLAHLRIACIDSSEVVTIATMTENFLEGIRRALEPRRL
jgi:glycosyltransferase involved in cell wall biosynthesis